ncbi:MAG: hypothetical protein M1814_005374 [Vezdaea aestivalis]|nr:MAG: hypothetical protein M1814_005374 [Vezdaea aestivalis]
MPPNTDISHEFDFVSLDGFFRQSDPETNDEDFDYTKHSFGLINRDYDTDKSFDPENLKTQWQRFEYYVSNLNTESPKNVQYKVLFMGRHGEGDHNVAETFYGTPAWDSHWSKLDGNGTVIWADAHLTSIGTSQARAANVFWAKEIQEQKIPFPARYYVSPLYRCLQTANESFGSLNLPKDKPFAPQIKELLRECIGIHTCDRRSTKTYLHSEFPSFAFENGFSEDDLLWRPDVREDVPTHVARLRKLLSDVFEHDESTFVSFTSHSGSITSVLVAIHHRKFALATGSIIPVFVKATKVVSP